MNFERGIDPKEAIGIGKKANPIVLRAIEEIYPGWPGNSHKLNFVHGRKLLDDICNSESESEVLFNLLNRKIMLVFSNEDKTNIKYMWRKWVQYEGFKCRIPEFLNPENVSGFRNRIYPL